MSLPPHPPDLDLDAVVASHGAFLWATLQRMGVREPNLADVMQELLIVVHRRLPSYDRARPLAPWLFGVCLRVVMAWRRRAWFRRERPVDVVPETADGGADPEQAASAAEDRRRIEALLAGMDPEKRAVFVMFEMEQMTCEEIAAAVGVPVGTVWSRLHLARKQFKDACARQEKREAKGRWL
jgi:RNA polymerase sigma-70 factor (ECF subfamily)